MASTQSVVPRVATPVSTGRAVGLQALQAVTQHMLVDDRRLYPRLPLDLRVCLKRVAGQPERSATPLRTRDISSCGVYLLSPRQIEPGTPIELEITLVERPRNGHGVRMLTLGHIVRAEPAQLPGWHGLAVTFDDITFDRA